MRYKRITIKEFKRTFLITILECINCKFWYQAMELKVEGLLPVKNWEILYNDPRVPCLHEIPDRNSCTSLHPDHKNYLSEDGDLLERMQLGDGAPFLDYILF